MAKDKNTNKQTTREERYQQKIDDATAIKTALISSINSYDLNKSEDRHALNSLNRAYNTIKYADDFTRIMNIPVTSESKIAEKMIYVAENIDGVILKIQEKLEEKMKMNDIDDMITEAKSLKEINKSIEEATGTLSGIINAQLKNGNGTNRQIAFYRNETAKNNVDIIAKMLKDGKTKEDVYTHFSIDERAYNSVKKDVRNKLFELSKTEIEKNLKAGKTFQDIASELKVDKNALISFCKNHELAENVQKTDAVVEDTKKVPKVEPKKETKKTTTSAA